MPTLDPAVMGLSLGRRGERAPRRRERAAPALDQAQPEPGGERDVPRARLRADGGDAFL